MCFFAVWYFCLALAREKKHEADFYSKAASMLLLVWLHSVLLLLDTSFATKRTENPTSIIDNEKNQDVHPNYNVTIPQYEGGD